MVLTNASDAFRFAEEKLRAGEYQEALSTYLRIVRSVPDHWRSRFRIADTLLSLKAPHWSLEIYKNLAWMALKAGQPLQGLVAIKMAAAMDRSQADLVQVLADLYCRESDRIDRNLTLKPPRSLSKGDPLGEAGFQQGDQLVDEAGKVAADTSNIQNFPDKLPPIPLFSFLSRNAIGEVLAGLQLRRFVKDQDIIKEGDTGESFFILADGDVQVTRQQHGKTLPLARLHGGAVFGEIALVKDAPRTASVSAAADCELLELHRKVLQASGNKLASVTTALHEFTQSRFLHNLAATCAIFRPFPRPIRNEIINRFESFNAKAHQVIISQGEEGKGLFLIVKGQVAVTKKGDDGEDHQLAILKEGDVFGEISLINASTTTASCHAVDAAELLFLPIKSFNSTVARHPELKDELAKITADRIQKTKNMLDPEDEEFILIEEDDLIML